MEFQLNRRRFGQLALASTTLAGLGYLAKQATAQTANMLYGVSAGANAKSLQARANGVTVAGGLVLQSLDLTSGAAKDIAVGRTVGDAASAKAKLLPESISGFSALPDGTLVLATTPLRTARVAEPSRLAILGPTSQILPVVGLAKADMIMSLQSLSADSLLAVIGRNGAARPYRLATIDLKTTRLTILSNFALPGNQRIGVLTRCPRGTIYAVVDGNRGGRSLVQIDLQQQRVINLVPLQIGKRPLPNGLRSLACAPSGQLLALYSSRYGGDTSVYSIDLATGAMTLIKPFAVAAMTFA
jgi:hypothetical protein